MSWRLVGPSCREQDCLAPVYSQDGRCRKHYALAVAFGHSPDPEPDPRILDHRSMEFSTELNTWRAA